MSTSPLKLAKTAVRKAKDCGADQVEVFAVHSESINVELQKNDIHNVGVSEETSVGIRVLKNNGIGFVHVNSESALNDACAEALAIAQVAPPDEFNRLRDPENIKPLENGPDQGIKDLQIEDVVKVAQEFLARACSKDDRVMIDSGDTWTASSDYALVTSTGVECSDRRSLAGGSLFGMAVDGDDVGSFDYDGHQVTSLNDLLPQLLAAADRFIIKTLGALGATQGETFRGPIILTPEVVSSFVVGNITSTLSGRAVRNGRSPFAQRQGEMIISPLLTLKDQPRLDGGTSNRAFDREGTPTQEMTLVEEGVLKGFLYDVYEARRAETNPTGHAMGGAASVPGIGPSNLVLTQGDQGFTRICTDPERAVVVNRFSGSCNPVTGEFSGVVKGGFMMRNGSRTPIKETLIAGNLFEALNRVSGVSSEVRNINGSRIMPSLRLEDISITAG